MKNRIAGATSAIILAAGLSMAMMSSAVAQPPGQPSANKAPPPHHMMAMKKDLQSLDLSVAQQQQLKTITEDTRTKLKPLMEVVVQSQEGLAKQIHNENYKQSAVDKLAKQQGHTIAQMISVRAASMHKMFNVLTPEQKVKLQSIKQSGGPAS